MIPMIPRADGWHPSILIRTDEGHPWALIEYKTGHLVKTEPGDLENHWTLSDFANLRRLGHLCVLQAPFIETRVRCLSHEAAEFVARCAISTTPQTKPEYTLIRYTAPSGLLERCVHDIPPSHCNNDPRAYWTAEEANLWQSFALADGGPGQRGATWKGTRHLPLAPLRANDEHRTNETIPLPHKRSTPRTVPPSAPTFGESSIDIADLGRWLAKFAQIRTIEQSNIDNHDFEAATRGMPEGGGLAALRLWLAIHRVNQVDRGLYAYNAIDHNLRPVARDIDGILRVSMESMRGINGEPAGVVVISNRMDRLGAKYHRISLSIALQNAGACIAAAAVAGSAENIRTRGNGAIPGDEWLSATRIDPRIEVPIAAFAFGN